MKVHVQLRSLSEGNALENHMRSLLNSLHCWTLNLLFPTLWLMRSYILFLLNCSLTLLQTDGVHNPVAEVWGDGCDAWVVSWWEPVWSVSESEHGSCMYLGYIPHEQTRVCVVCVNVCVCFFFIFSGHLWAAAWCFAPNQTWLSALGDLDWI